MVRAIIDPVNLIGPTIFTILLYFFCRHPIIFSQFKVTDTIADLIPIIPSDKQTIWTIGYLSGQNTPEALAEASKIIGYNFGTHEELVSFSKALQVNSESLISRVWSYVSFVNILIVFSAIGMIITFLPALHTIIGPFMNIFGNLIVFLLKNKFVFEAFCYICSFGLIAYAAHLPKSYGVYVALLGSAGYVLSVLNFVVQTPKHTGGHATTELATEIHNIVFGLLIGVVNVMLASFYNSQLLGFVSVFSLYCSLEFGVDVGYHSFGVGFRNRDVVFNCAITSLIFICATFYARTHFIELFKPFFAPAFVMGPVVYFLALLITTSAWHRSPVEYSQAQLLMIISIVAMLFFGSIYQVYAVVNVTITYASLYLLEKFAEMKFWQEKMALFIFVLSLLVFRIGLYLHANPAFMVAMLNPSQ